jgi:fermentation-respiration switch protein FrsA (DUF1100 family)
MRMLAACLFVVCALVAILWIQQRRLIYFPFGTVPDPESVGLTSIEAVSLATSDGLALGGWFVGARDKASFTVIVFNGNGGNRGYRAGLAIALARRGFAVLLFDYRGYGGNPGTPSEEGLARDARAARAYLRTRRDVDPARIVYFGESLGSAVATTLAVESPPSALILRSPFTSLEEVGRHHYPFLPVRWLLHDRFATIDRIGRLAAPLLVIAGDRDRIVPTALSLKLYESANEPKTLRIVRGTDHNDAALAEGEGMIESIVEFLRNV